MDSEIREGLIKDMVDSGVIIRRDAVDELAEAAEQAEPGALRARLTTAEKARRAAERLYKPGEIVVDAKGAEYACCNDGSLRHTSGHLRLRKKQRTKLRRMLKEGA